jgi:HPr kinase/phosphorylase
VAERPAPAAPAPDPPPVEQTTISAGFLRIFGLGTLILGDSGIGKSESALELIARGHRFVADDVVQVRVGPGGELWGTAPSLSRNFMEIRGLGIINIRAIFGPRSIARQARVDLVIRLKKWRRGYEVDRLGLKSGDDLPLLGRRIPQLAIPVAPGRNIATLIEVACKVHILRQKGYSAPDEIIRRLDRVLT